MKLSIAVLGLVAGLAVAAPTSEDTADAALNKLGWIIQAIYEDSYANAPGLEARDNEDTLVVRVPRAVLDAITKRDNDGVAASDIILGVSYLKDPEA